MGGWLTDEQLALLRGHGEERTAEVGDVLYRVGDRTYPFIAILEGEAAIVDAQGEEIVRHGAHGVHGERRRLDGVTLKDGTRLPVKFVFMFLGATPCTDWLGDTVARDDHGFVVTGGPRLLETSVPGVFAVGDVRSGSVKRCATAAGEGAMVVRLVHERMPVVVAA